MKEDKFIKENIALWKSLEETLQKLRLKGIQKFTKNELDDFITMYNRTCGHLSYCRTNYGSVGTTEYLNRLVASAHSYIYNTKTSNIKGLFRFLLIEFPLLLRKNIRFFIISSSLFMFGMLLSFILTLISSDNAYAFLPPQYSQAVENIGTGGGGGSSWDNPIMSSSIMTNNTMVGFLAFSLGITLGIGTTYTLINNGFILGSLYALVFKKGLHVWFWAYILPHGIIELFAIFVCGAAGLMIGYAIISPGRYSRKDSFIIRGKESIKLVCGTIPLFVIAGLIEGFITPSGIPHGGKLFFALFTLLLLLFYLIYPNQKFKKTTHEHSSPSTLFLQN